ncbi:MAG: metallophosphoesterase family protein [Oscillospiraceae bacterium]|jgi:hypothetical protein|nr:metallophosphoesterase family protein [Oscillospiraceae bacterium]
MPKPVRGSTAVPDHILLTLRGDASTERAVTWRTDVEITAGYVLYRRTDISGAPWQRTDAAQGLFASDIDSSRMHWAHLQKLTPGAAYEYTCGDEENRSAAYTFQMPPVNIKRFKFLCVSDQQCGEPHDCPDYSRFNVLLKTALQQHPDTAFILTGGDNTDCGQHEVQWNGAFCGLAGIAESVPFMMTLGNHDNRGFADYRNGIGRYYSEPAAFFGKQFQGSYPANGPEGWQTENYAFDYGDAHICVIGINAPETVNAWLLEQHKNSKARWKLGVYHFPICYSGADCQNNDAYPIMRDGFEGFDLVFAGHEHNFARSFPLKNEELFERPSQGTVHYTLGNSNYGGPGCHPMPKVWHSAFYPQEEGAAMLCVVEVVGDSMTLTSVLHDGRVADRCTVNKATDTIEPPALPPLYANTRMLFKGWDPGLCQADTPCRHRDGVWFAPLAILVASIGGVVERSAGKLRMAVYDHWLECAAGSSVAQSDAGESMLPAPVYCGERGQLYIPCDACGAFGMRWAYAPRNNFISFEHESEARPVVEQP